MKKHANVMNETSVSGNHNKTLKIGLCGHGKVKKKLTTKIFKNCFTILSCPVTTISSQENSLRAGYTYLCCIINNLAN